MNAHGRPWPKGRALAWGVAADLARPVARLGALPDGHDDSLAGGGPDTTPARRASVSGARIAPTGWRRRWAHEAGQAALFDAQPGEGRHRLGGRVGLRREATHQLGGGVGGLVGVVGAHRGVGVGGTLPRDARSGGG